MEGFFPPLSQLAQGEEWFFNPLAFLVSVDVCEEAQESATAFHVALGRSRVCLEPQFPHLSDGHSFVRCFPTPRGLS